MAQNSVNIGHVIIPDLGLARREIVKAALEISSPYNDGFTSWELKKSLWSLKFLLDSELANLPEFQGESDWLAEQRMLQAEQILRSPD